MIPAHVYLDAYTVAQSSLSLLRTLAGQRITTSSLPQTQTYARPPARSLLQFFSL
jgi:hypothetical protein